MRHLLLILRDSTRKLLNASDEIVSGERHPTSNYWVSGLIHGSPAAISLTVEPRDQATSFSVKTIEYFVSGLSSIRDYGVIPVDATDALLDNAVRLIKGCSKPFQTTVVPNG